MILIKFHITYGYDHMEQYCRSDLYSSIKGIWRKVMKRCGFDVLKVVLNDLWFISEIFPLKTDSAYIIFLQELRGNLTLWFGTRRNRSAPQSFVMTLKGEESITGITRHIHKVAKVVIQLEIFHHGMMRQIGSTTLYWIWKNKQIDRIKWFWQLTPFSLTTGHPAIT